jgi:hypothetical protein
MAIANTVAGTNRGRTTLSGDSLPILLFGNTPRDINCKGERTLVWDTAKVQHTWGLLAQPSHAERGILVDLPT